MTAAITPKRVLSALEGYCPWYKREVLEDGSFRFDGIKIPYKRFREAMEKNGISYNQRTIKYHWNELKSRGFLIKSEQDPEIKKHYWNDPEILDCALSVPDAIAEYLNVKMTNWIPSRERAKGLGRYCVGTLHGL